MSGVSWGVVETSWNVVERRGNVVERRGNVVERRGNVVETSWNVVERRGVCLWDKSQKQHKKHKKTNFAQQIKKTLQKRLTTTKNTKTQSKTQILFKKQQIIATALKNS